MCSRSVKYEVPAILHDNKVGELNFAGAVHGSGNGDARDIARTHRSLFELTLYLLYRPDKLLLWQRRVTVWLRYVNTTCGFCAPLSALGSCLAGQLGPLGE